MLVDTKNMVPASKFRAGLAGYIEAAKKNHEVIAVTMNGEVAGFFIGAEEYETLVGSAVKEFLSGREKGETVSHAGAKARISRIIRRKTKK